MPRQHHEFGGSWTEDKLDRITKYLQAYATALKNQPFRRLYVDAFAGTGYRASRRPGETVRGLFQLPETTALAQGSARRALEIEPPFDEYVFIEANLGHFRELRRLDQEYPGRHDRIRFINEEANGAIEKICCSTDWRRWRSVMFLDPYGMQVDWKSIEKIAGVRHIDLWYLFPVGTVQRLLPRRGRISPGWETALDRLLGDPGWRTDFYEISRQLSLLGDTAGQRKVADVCVIEEYVSRRLARIFEGGVAKKALELRNSKGSCLYLLFFACGNPNPKAHGLALKFASHVLRAR
jgi:three-Cys-motif partner protein